MAIETSPVELPQAFERRLGIQLVEEGLETQRQFFKKVTTDLLHCGKGDIDECQAASEFTERFGKAYLNACHAYMANLPLSAFVSSMAMPKTFGLTPEDTRVLSLMLFCEVTGPTGVIVDSTGTLTDKAKAHLAVTTFMVHVSKFSTKRPDETVDECLHRFIASEKATFEAMQLDDSPEVVKWTPRYIYDMAITRMIEAMEPEFVTMSLASDCVRFVVHQDIPGTEYYKATFILVNLDVLLTQGIQSFEKQIYRHPRYRAASPDTPKEAIVENKVERDIAVVIQEVLAEIPHDVKDTDPSRSYIQELDEILESLPFTAPEAMNVRWNSFIETMNDWMPPADILEHEWMLKAIAKMMDQPEEKVRELTQRYVDAGGDEDD